MTKDREVYFIYPTTNGWQVGEGKIESVVGHVHNIGDFWVEDVFYKLSDAVGAMEKRNVTSSDPCAFCGESNATFGPVFFLDKVDGLYFCDRQCRDMKR